MNQAIHVLLTEDEESATFITIAMTISHNFTFTESNPDH